MEYEYEWDIISNNIPLILPDLMIFKVRNGKEIDRNPLKRDPLGCWGSIRIASNGDKSDLFQLHWLRQFKDNMSHQKNRMLGKKTENILYNMYILYVQIYNSIHVVM